VGQAFRPADWLSSQSSRLKGGSSGDAALKGMVIDWRQVSQEKMIKASRRSPRVKAALDNEANRQWKMKRR
jgi:hypothetical protein